MSYMKFSCVYCGQHIECDTMLRGRQFHCPSCKLKIVVPPPDTFRTGRAMAPVNETWDTLVPEPQAEAPAGDFWLKDSQSGQSPGQL